MINRNHFNGCVNLHRKYILKDTRGAQNSLICKVMKSKNHNPDFGHTWGEIQFWW
jgi:hypothetical protein